ncbi:MAG: potassium channel protein [Kofleriaceae bacterium]
MERSLRNRLIGGSVAMAIVVLAGTAGYYAIGDGRWSLGDCLYMTMITVTTVGYGEALDGMAEVAYARPFTVALLVFGTGILVYFVSTVTAFVVEGELANVLRARKREKRIRHMKGHILVCGAGSTGRHIIGELLAAATPHQVVAVDTNEAALRELAARHPDRLQYLVGDATEDSMLAQAGASQASGVVAALSSDKDNLYVVVSVRQLNAGARIIARCADLAHVEKLRRAGADAVVSPNYIGGMRMVSELIRPTVVRFLDEMLRDARAAYRIDEVEVAAGSELAGVALRDARIPERFGMSVLAFRNQGDTLWHYNPGPDEVVGADAVLVVLGSAEQVARLRDAAGAR